MNANDDLGFAPEEDAPIPYMQRIRDYYLALGYPAPYRWAHYAEVPFQLLEKPLAQCRVALITTAAPTLPLVGAKLVISGAAGVRFQSRVMLPLAPL